MPFYHKMGKFPHKRHTVFKSESGNFYYEELFGTEGFSSMSSLLYHVHRATMIRSVGDPVDLTPVAALEKKITSRSLNGFIVHRQDDCLQGRQVG